MEKPARSELLKLYYTAIRKRSLPTADTIITTLREQTDEWDKFIVHPSIATPSNLDDGSAMSLISSELATKLNIPIITLKDGITINAIINTKSKCNTFAYIQIKLEGQSSNWRAMLLCAVMTDSSIPLLIGSNDLAAYKMTPVSYARALIIGDFLTGTQPLEYVGLMPHDD